MNLLINIALRLVMWAHFKKWEYGVFRDSQFARRNRVTGGVQFNMSSKCDEDFWVYSDESWWNTFRQSDIYKMSVMRKIRELMET